MRSSPAAPAFSKASLTLLQRVQSLAEPQRVERESGPFHASYQSGLKCWLQACLESWENDTASIR